MKLTIIGATGNVGSRILSQALDAGHDVTVLARRKVLGGFMGDKAASDALLQDSGLPWTIIYPVNLKDTPATGTAAMLPLHEVRKVPGLPTLGFEDAASKILTAAQDARTATQRLLVTTAKGYRA